MNDFFANTVIEKIQTELTNRKIDTNIVNQITDFLKPHLNNVNFASLPQNAQNLKNQFSGFLETHKGTIGEENLNKIQQTVGGVLSLETLQKLQNDDLIPGTDLDNGIIAKIKSWFGIKK